MRVTDKMMFENAALYSGRARSNMERAVSEAATGLRVEHPWDDPVAAGLIVQHRLGMHRFEMLGRTAQRAAEELGAADGALEGVGESLERGVEVATRMANGTYNASDRTAAAAEVDGLFKMILGLVNRQVGDRYIFGGTDDSNAPFDLAGAYTGATNQRFVEVAPGQVEQASLDANTIIKGFGGGVDIMTTLEDLAQALRDNDPSEISNLLGDLHTSVSQVALGRAQAGTSMNLFEMAVETSKVAHDTEQVSLAHQTDADIIDAASRLALAQRALDAALTVSARSFELTLLNKVR